MRTVVLGAGGQLAHELLQILGDAVPLAHADLDVTSATNINETLAALEPAVVVNTAAYNMVDRAEEQPSAAFAVNFTGPLHVARACRRLGALLVHFSTDYVFGLDSSRSAPWEETDVPGPVSVYGASKLAGEYAVRAYCPKHLVIRTCGLYGVKGSRGKGGNFVETMLRLAATGNPVRVVNDQTCTPSFAQDVARTTAHMIERQFTGLFHLTNGGACTWYEFASAVFRLAGLTVDCRPVASSDFGLAARRPAYSVLSNAKLAAAGIRPCSHWRDALGRYFELRPARTPADPSAGNTSRE
jgi:dTDP-4-dehydrorhamnose reductase